MSEIGKKPHNDAKPNGNKRKPKKDNYKPEYCDLLIRHMSKGLSFDSFGAKANCGKTTLYEWVKKYPEFAEAKKKATAKAQEFFESRLAAKISGQQIPGINTKNIDTACLIFALKTRFHETYSEKKEEEKQVIQVIVPEPGADKL
jgi:hypothetical protein